MGFHLFLERNSTFLVHFACYFWERADRKYPCGNNCILQEAMHVSDVQQKVFKETAAYFYCETNSLIVLLNLGYNLGMPVVTVGEYIVEL